MMAFKKVTKEQVIESYYRNFRKHSAVAKDLNISRERVRQICDSLNLPSDKNYKVKFTIKNTNKTIPELSKELDISRSHLKKLATMENVVLDKGIHPNVKYTAEKLIELYKEFNGHYSNIAKHLSIPQPCVSRLFKLRGLKEQYPSLGRNKQ